MGNFACKDDVNKILGCDQGSVSPFGVMYNQDPSKLRVVIDTPLMFNPFNLFMYFHPFMSCEAVSISARNLTKFVEYFDHKLELMNLFELCEIDEKYLDAEKDRKPVNVLTSKDAPSNFVNDIIDSLYSCTIM